MDFQSIREYFKDPGPKQLPVQVAVCYVLHSLWNEDSSDTEMIQALESGGDFLLSHNTMYDALKFLEGTEHIEGFWEPQGTPDEAMRPRRCYKLTRAGLLKAFEFSELWTRWSRKVKAS